MNYENYYKNYWEFSKHDRKTCFDSLYGRIKHKLVPRKDCKIIDLGGGDGQFLNFLGVKKAFVIDVSESGLSLAESVLGFDTLKADLSKPLPFVGLFDVAYCFETAEHLEWPNFLFKNINSVLKSGGLLFLAIPNGRIDGVHHKKRWNFVDLVEELGVNGFRVVWVDF